MALQDQPFSINYGSGVSTKTDPKQLPVGKLLRLENALFTSAKRINKRLGNTKMTRAIVDNFSPGVLTDPKAAEAYGEELLVAATNTGVNLTGRRLFSYSTTANAWVDKGKYVPVKVSNEVILGDYPSLLTSSAVSGNYACVASLVSNFLGNAIIFTIYDTTTGTAVLPEQSFATAINTALQVIPLGTGKFGIIQSPSTNSISMNIVTITGSTSTVTVATLKTDAEPGANMFYAVSLGTTAVCLYTDNSGSKNVKLFAFNAAGTVTNTVTISTSTTAAYKYLNYDSVSGNVWGYYTDSTNTYFFVRNASTLVSVLARTLITANASDVISSYKFSTTNQQVLLAYGGDVNRVGVTTSGSGSPTLFMSTTRLLGEPITVGSNIYIPVMFDSASGQSTIFLVDTADKLPVAKALSGKAKYVAGKQTASYYVVNSTQVVMTTSYTVTAFSDVQGVMQVTFDFDHADLYQMQQVGGIAVWNGGFLTEYDGQETVELGFHLYPDYITLAPHASGGNMADGSYEYSAVYQWIDAKGNLFQSAPISAIGVVSGGGGSGSVSITIPYLPVTAKQLQANNRGAVTISLYRTPAGGVAQHQLPIATIFNLTTTQSVTVVDTFADSAIAATPLLYTSGGVLENNAPPPAVAMEVHNNRLQVIDSENPNTLWYSKSVQPLVGVSFSGFMIVQIPAVGGAVVSISRMDDKLVILEEKQPLVMAGDGVNDAGQNSSLSFPQAIPSDVGAVGDKGTLLSPLGVHFKTPKGLYLLDRSLTLTYWGSEIEAYNDQDITASYIMPGTTQMRFLTSDGLTLAYDYFFQQWSTFTNYEGYGATIWNGTQVYARVDGEIYQENTTSFLDDTAVIAVKAQTAWIKGATIQGFQRLKQFLQLGDYVNGASASHGMQVSIAYDYLTNPNLPTFSNPVPYYFSSAASTGGSFQFRQFIAQQKCESATFLIEELPTGASGESFNLTDMTIIAGVKKGGFKLPAAQTAV